MQRNGRWEYEEGEDEVERLSNQAESLTEHLGEALGHICPEVTLI